MTNDNRGKSMYCSVLFVDMVGYSKKTNAEQTVLKQKFVSSWEEAIQNIPAEDIMVVDSGDGAALTALKDTEDTLRVAKNLCRILIREKDMNPATMFQLRLGIHFGPVELSTDVHGKSCIVGDAINVASRVMSFAGANQLLVSRSYYDLIRPLSQDNEKAFNFFETHHDKHGRPHELYEFVGPGASPTQKYPAVDKPSQPVKSTSESAAPAEKQRSAFVSLLMSIVTFPVRLFGNIWSGFKRLVALSIVFIVIYELFVITPILNEPDMLRKELIKQTKSVKTIFQFGNEIIVDTSQTLKSEVDSGTSNPAKKSQDKK